eukprot:4223562-Amphidinium_carterae.1
MGTLFGIHCTEIKFKTAFNCHASAITVSSCCKDNNSDYLNGRDFLGRRCGAVGRVGTRANKELDFLLT